MIDLAGEFITIRNNQISQMREMPNVPDEVRALVENQFFQVGKITWVDYEVVLWLLFLLCM